MFTTTQDIVQSVTDTISKFPKTSAEVASLLEKTQKVAEVESAKVTSVLETYQKAATGKASVNELYAANKKVGELFVTARFAATMAMPGAIFALPFLTQMAKEFDVDFVPQSVKAEFGI